MSAISVGQRADGTITYIVGVSPSALPPVLRRDLLRAWEAARAGALAHREGPVRAFRFARADGGATTMALTDRDARSWAGAADATHSLGGAYGMSLCLRLLALIELLAAHKWAAAHARITRAGTELGAPLLRLAAEAALDDDGRFDVAAFRAVLLALPASLPATSVLGDAARLSAPAEGT